MTEISQFALISLGSNEPSHWGDARDTVQKAMLVLAKSAGNAARSSPLYATSAFPAGSGPDFVNAAMAIRTQDSPHDLLGLLHRIEAEAGRERKVRWGQRTLDLDLIALGSQIWPDIATQTAWRDLPLKDQLKDIPTELILPHPRLQDRAFVLVPLADVAPDWVHPVLQRTVADMCAALPPDAIADVRPL